MRKITWKAILIGFLILIATNLIILLIKPYITFIPDSVWDALGVTFGLSYLITYNLEYKTNTNVSLRTQKIMSYLLACVIIFLFYFGFSFIWDKLF